MPEATRRYHHGDLRRALVEAGLTMTRTQGPTALGVREAARRVGVSPTATYRHFADRDELLDAVVEEIQNRMATRMRRPRSSQDTPAGRARDRLRAVGLGYIEFALAEPGWFATAFFRPRSGPDNAQTRSTPVAPPYRLLSEALDAMVEAGALSAAQRAEAEWPCWSAVHGFADLALRGPLRDRPKAAVRRLAARTVDGIIAGL